MNESCVFCMLNEDTLNYYKKFQVKALFDSENFKIICDFQPVSPYHILIISKDHHFSMLELDDKKSNELKELKSKISEFYKAELDLDTFYFEHGNCNDNCSSSCIEHAHLHAIPLSNQILKNILAQLLQILGQPNNFNGKKSYLMAGFSSNNKMIWLEKMAKHQFFRILISDISNNLNRGIWQYCNNSELEQSVSRQYIDATELLWEKFK